MLPEVAYVKLAWALGQTDDLDKVRELMLTPICGEITEREPHDGYMVFQGGMPEMAAFMKTVHK
jgi:glutamyl-tRNA(Gln) amidotransferase subunit D